MPVGSRIVRAEMRDAVSAEKHCAGSRVLESILPAKVGREGGSRRSAQAVRWFGRAKGGSG